MINLVLVGAGNLEADGLSLRKDRAAVEQGERMAVELDVLSVLEPNRAGTPYGG